MSSAGRSVVRKPFCGVRWEIEESKWLSRRADEVVDDVFAEAMGSLEDGWDLLPGEPCCEEKSCQDGDIGHPRKACVLERVHLAGLCKVVCELEVYIEEGC